MYFSKILTRQRVNRSTRPKRILFTLTHFIKHVVTRVVGGSLGNTKKVGNSGEPTQMNSDWTHSSGVGTGSSNPN
ncbi:hypothetical protein HanPSC8_Chr06g0236081 [Helianthus annuus]|nr:hypothetical protein HanPSC8_Chr06g0236081 [Helianthus annuus]